MLLLMLLLLLLLLPRADMVLVIFSRTPPESRADLKGFRDSESLVQHLVRMEEYPGRRVYVCEEALVNLPCPIPICP